MVIDFFSLAYAVDLAQSLSGGVGNSAKSWKTAFELVHWTDIHHVRHRLSVTTDRGAKNPFLNLIQGVFGGFVLVF